MQTSMEFDKQKCLTVRFLVATQIIFGIHIEHYIGKSIHVLMNGFGDPITSEFTLRKLHKNSNI